MATYTLTPNLGLRVESDISVNDKYNLTRIDELASRLNISSSGATTVSALSDVYILAKTGAGASQTNGNILLRAGTLKSLDTDSSIVLQAREISLEGKTDNADEASPSVISFKADTINFNDATIVGLHSEEMAEHLVSYSHADIALNTASRHTHSNYTVLAATEESFTSELKAQYDAAVASGGFTSIQKTLSGEDITNGYVSLPSEPAVPVDTMCLPQGAPNQFYGEAQDYYVSGNKLYFSSATILSMGYALEEGDNLAILYR